MSGFATWWILCEFYMVYEGCNEVVHGVINQQNPTHISLRGPHLVRSKNLKSLKQSESKNESNSQTAEIIRNWNSSNSSDFFGWPKSNYSNLSWFLSSCTCPFRLRLRARKLARCRRWGSTRPEICASWGCEQNMDRTYVCTYIYIYIYFMADCGSIAEPPKYLDIFGFTVVGM